jgi:hypothetical protein
MLCNCPPWQLDPGGPCQDDGLGVFSYLIRAVTIAILLFTYYDSHRAKKNHTLKLSGYLLHLFNFGKKHD